uniref:Uncharacterized protein n=2 Tax=Timema TaxID=61471 RepID=A0A7R9ALN8_TIMSH|nr:unnamed protein product [Timema shepardi]CAD7568280.1 unnamed protein product [Timema californicum]
MAGTGPILDQPARSCVQYLRPAPRKISHLSDVICSLVYANTVNKSQYFPCLYYRATLTITGCRSEAKRAVTRPTSLDIYSLRRSKKLIPVEMIEVNITTSRTKEELFTRLFLGEVTF